MVFLQFDVQRDVGALTKVMADGCLIVEEEPYGPELLAWIASHERHVPIGSQALVDWIKERSENEPAFSSLLSQYSHSLSTILAANNSATDSLWSAERAAVQTRICHTTSKNTFIRRGLAKLACLSDRSIAYQLVSGYMSGALPHEYSRLGIISHSILGSTISDIEIKNAVSLLGKAVSERVIQVSVTPAMDAIIQPLRNENLFATIANVVGQHAANLSSTTYLFELLERSHADPEGFLSAAAGGTPSLYEGVHAGFLARFLVETFKAIDGRRQSFGRAHWLNLLRAQQVEPSERAVLEETARGLGISVTWRSETTVHYGYRDWVFGEHRSNFPLSRFDLLRVAHLLAQEVGQRGARAVLNARDTAIRFWTEDIVETEVLTYNGFSPLEFLIRDACLSAGFTPEKHLYFESCFRQLVLNRWGSISERAGGTTVFRVRNTVINWQSVSDAGRNHKVKELCGRAPALRYMWEPVTQKFISRPSVARLVLVLDGTWRQEDLDALTRAGWDSIFYPDEMDKIVKAIV